MSAPPLNNEDAYIMRLAQSNPAAFAPLYERYADRIYAFCRSRTGDAQTAEDLCSQVFVRALRAVHSYAGGRVDAWLFRIARNLITDHYRQQRSLSDIDDLDIATDRQIDAGIEQEEQFHFLGHLLDELPAEKRHLLALALNQNLSYDDIAEMVGKSAGSIRVEVHRIIARLRVRYQEITEEQTRL